MGLASMLRCQATRNRLAVTALVVAGLFGLTSSASAAVVGTGGPATSVSAAPHPSATGSVEQTASLDQTVRGDTATFFGLVLRDEDGDLPTKVRAIGQTGVVCGTGNVQRLNGGDGYYSMEIAGSDTRAGCPSTGQAVAFRLLYGSVDDGSFALTSQSVRFEAGQRFLVSLTPAPSSESGDWLGALPDAAGEAVTLTWVGLDRTPIATALRALDLPVARVSQYDADLGRWLSYTPGGPSFLQSYLTLGYGDVVRLRLQ